MMIEKDVWTIIQLSKQIMNYSGKSKSILKLKLHPFNYTPVSTWLRFMNALNIVCLAAA